METQICSITYKKREEFRYQHIHFGNKTWVFSEEYERNGGCMLIRSSNLLSVLANCVDASSLRRNCHDLTSLLEVLFLFFQYPLLRDLTFFYILKVSWTLFSLALMKGEPEMTPGSTRSQPVGMTFFIAYSWRSLLCDLSCICNGNVGHKKMHVGSLLRLSTAIIMFPGW